MDDGVNPAIINVIEQEGGGDYRFVTPPSEKLITYSGVANLISGMSATNSPILAQTALALQKQSAGKNLILHEFYYSKKLKINEPLVCVITRGSHVSSSLHGKSLFALMSLRMQRDDPDPWCPESTAQRIWLGPCYQSESFLWDWKLRGCRQVSVHSIKLMSYLNPFLAGWLLITLNFFYRTYKLMRKVEPYRVAGLEWFSTALWHLQQEIELSALAQDLITVERQQSATWITAGNCFSLNKEHETAIKFFERAIQVSRVHCGVECWINSIDWYSV